MHTNFQHISEREGITPFSNRWSQFYTRMRMAENNSFLLEEFTSFEMEFNDLTRNINVEEIGLMRRGMQELRTLL